MGIDRAEAARTLLGSRNVVEAMTVYIERNGCNGFRCKKCPLELVCDHYPSHARDYAHAVIERTREVLSAGQHPQGTSEAR